MGRKQFPFETNPVLRGAVISILGEAIAIAEHSGEDKALFIPRLQIGLLLQQLGLEKEFGNDAIETIRSAEALRDRLNAPSAEWQTRSKRIRELDDAAKLCLLSGNLEGAEEIYLSAEELRPDHDRLTWCSRRFSRLET
jgi:hypothetical protein